MAQSLFKTLKHRYPQDELHVAAPSYNQVLLQRMPEVDRTWIMPYRHGSLYLRSQYRMARTWRTLALDQTIVLPGSFKSALMPFWSRARRRTGWLGECRFGLLNDIRYQPKYHARVVDRYVALGWDKTTTDFETPYPALRVDEDNQQCLIDAWRLRFDGPVAALCPGAAKHETKRWPKSYFGQLAQKLRQQGWQVWLLGGQQEHTTAQFIVEASGGGVNLCGQISLLDTLDLLSLASVVVSNDSGLMHMAAAAGVPVVAIYGSTKATLAPPLTTRAKTLSVDLPCRPCGKHLQCPLKHLKCLRQIAPQRVHQAIEDLYEHSVG